MLATQQPSSAFSAPYMHVPGIPIVTRRTARTAPRPMRVISFPIPPSARARRAPPLPPRIARLQAPAAAYTLTDNPFADPDAITNAAEPVSEPRARTSPAVTTVAPAHPRTRPSYASAARAAPVQPAPPPLPERGVRANAVACLLLHRAHARPLRRWAQAGPRAYVRSRLSSVTVAETEGGDDDA